MVHYATISIRNRSSYIDDSFNETCLSVFILRCTKTRRSIWPTRTPYILTRHYRDIMSESSSLLYTIIRHQWGCIRCTRESIVGRSSSYACLLFVVTYVYAYLYVITVDYRRLPLLPWLPYRIRLLILGNKTFTQSTLPLLPGNYQVITQITRSGMGRG